jgi:GntR family phosphonate transport system transcriptional regulator
LNNAPPDQAEAGPLWSRIAQDLADAIGHGQYAPGMRLPSEHQLAAQFGANRHTIRRAMAHLCHNGLVRTTQGRGSFVENLAVDLVLGKRTRHRHNLAQAGLRGQLVVMHSETIEANLEQAQALQMPVGSAVLHMQVMGEGAGQALHMSQRYFPLPRFAQMASIVQSTGSITQGFADHGVSDYTRQVSHISARLPSKDVALCLGQSATRPVLLVKSINVDVQQLPIEFACTWFAGDRVSLTVQHDEH